MYFMHKRNEQKICLQYFQGKRPFDRPRCRWEDNIQIRLIEILRKHSELLFSYFAQSPVF
jgi:hypothetical protein